MRAEGGAGGLRVHEVLCVVGRKGSGEVGDG